MNDKNVYTSMYVVHVDFYITINILFINSLITKVIMKYRQIQFKYSY